MALRLTITSKDVKAEKLVKPGWYATQIQKTAQEMAKDKESFNFVIDVVGMEEDAKGVPVKCFFSEKFIQNINPLVRATGPLQGIKEPLNEETGLDPKYDLEKTENNVVYAQWVTDKGKDGQGKARNQIADWAPLPANHPLYVDTGGGSASDIPASGFKAG